VVVVHHEKACEEVGERLIRFGEVVDKIDEVDVIKEGRVVTDEEDLPKK